MRGKLRPALRGAVVLAVIFAAAYLMFEFIGGPDRNPELFIAKPVTARAETAPVGQEGGAADDAAIWVANDPKQSFILGSEAQGGLFAYSLTGDKQPVLPVSGLGHVAVRAGFELAGRQYALVAATDRKQGTIALFLLDPETHGVLRPYGGTISPNNGDPYGLCLYRSADGSHHVFAMNRDGRVHQFHVRADSGGGVTAEPVRKFKLKSTPEGCVADDRTGRLYIAEADRGIWRFGADPDAGKKRKLIARTDGQELAEDVKGLTLFPQGDRKGYLIASSRMASGISVFSLPNERLAGRFEIATSPDGTVDEVTGTDGVDATPVSLPGYPEGLLIVQDNRDDSGRQNFKLVDWREVKKALELE